MTASSHAGWKRKKPRRAGSLSRIRRRKSRKKAGCGRRSSYLAPHGNSPLSAPELVSGTIRAQRRKADELARNAHSLLASTQKPRPTAISLWVRSSNTTYSPWDSVVSSLMRMFAFARSLAGSNLRKLPAGSFVLSSKSQMENASMPPSLHGVFVKQTEGGKRVVTLSKDLARKIRN